MTVVFNVVLVALSALFLTIPYLNRNVFHTVNIDEIIASGREGLAKVQELQRERNLHESRDSGTVLIEKFRNDSAEVFASDVANWGKLLLLIKEKDPSFAAKLLIQQLKENDLALMRTYNGPEELTPLVRKQLVGMLNVIKKDSLLYCANQDKFEIHKNNKLAAQYKLLVEKGLILDQKGIRLKANLTAQERKSVEKFHVALLDQILYPAIIEKDYRRGMDWASEYIVQTAMYLVGASYTMEFELDEAIKMLDSLIFLYPKSIYAEVIFLENGKTFFADGKNNLANGQRATAEKQFRKGITYLEKIERNRDVARQFPKYKFADLHPGQYVNVDLASRAKRKIKEETAVYTSKMAKEELSGSNDDERSGYYLEDAIRLIGECYIQLERTDSARSQFNLILKFFPESDNLDNAQKLIADSYVKDGDLLLAQSDSGNANARSKANEFYTSAIKEYQRFVNVYPQSDLISETFISMGDAWSKMGRPDEAARSFAAALGRAKESEEQAKIQLKIGNYYYERKRYPEAVEAYQVILTNFLSTEVASNAVYLQGECFEALGDSTKALQSYDVILEYYKQSSFFGGSAFKIGNWHFERKNYKVALEAYRIGRAYINKSTDLAAKMQLQTGYIWRRISDGQQGDERATSLKEALKQFNVVVQDYEGTREADQAAYQMIDINFEQGNEKAARELIEKIGSRDIKAKVLILFSGQDENPEEDIKFWELQIAEAQENEEKATFFYEKALVLADKVRDNEGALKAYETAYELSNEDQKKINCQIGISRVYSALQRFDDAQQLLTELLQNKKVAPELRQQLEIQLYDALYRGKQYEKALDGFEGFAAQFPEHPMAAYAIYRIGMICADQQQYQKAIDKLRIVETKYAESNIYDKAVLGIGTQMISLEQHKEAVEYLEKFMKAHPDAQSAAAIYLKIGDTYSKYLSNNKKAITFLQTIVDSFPDDGQFSYAAYRLGMILKDEGQEENARAAFDKAKRSDGSIYRASQAEIGKLIAKTDPEAAIENYRRIVEQSETQEDSAIAMLGIGDVYGTIKKPQEAAQAYQLVYDFYKGTNEDLIAGAIVKWVDALVSSKQFKEAIRVAAIMQDRFATNAYAINAIYYEASAYFALEDFVKAHASFKKLIAAAQAAQGKQEQLEEIAYYQKADCIYFRKGDREAQMKAAIREYDEYVKKYPGGKYIARSLYMQGNAYVTLESFEEAANKMQLVVSKYPEFEEHCSAKNFYAFSLNRLDKWKVALKLYNEVLASGSCSAKAKEFAREQRESVISQH